MPILFNTGTTFIRLSTEDWGWSVSWVYMNSLISKCFPVTLKIGKEQPWERKATNVLPNIARKSLVGESSDCRGVQPEGNRCKSPFQTWILCQSSQLPATSLQVFPTCGPAGTPQGAYRLWKGHERETLFQLLRRREIIEGVSASLSAFMHSTSKGYIANTLQTTIRQRPRLQASQTILTCLLSPLLSLFSFLQKPTSIIFSHTIFKVLHSEILIVLVPKDKCVFFPRLCPPPPHERNGRTDVE